MKDLKSLLASRFKKSSLSKQIEAGLVVEFANQKIREFFGQKGACQARVLSLKNRLLKVNCASAIMAQEINFKKYKLIDLIDKKFGDGVVKKLKIVQSGVEKSAEQ